MGKEERKTDGWMAHQVKALWYLGPTQERETPFPQLSSDLYVPWQVPCTPPHRHIFHKIHMLSFQPWTMG